MKIMEENVNRSLQWILTILKCYGIYAPEFSTNWQRYLYNIYAAIMFTFVIGTFPILQTVELFVIRGDLTLMIAVIFLLFTYIVQTFKFFNFIIKRKRIDAIIEDSDKVLRAETTLEGKAMVKSCDNETFLLFVSFFGLSMTCITGWASSAEKNQLPMLAWYPYDTSSSPVFELAYFHQVASMYTAATWNVSKDILLATFISQCRCRLQLLGLKLKDLCADMDTGDMLTPEQEEVVSSRLRACVEEHQKVLNLVLEIESCFSGTTFLQCGVSLFIICTSAFQMALEAQGQNLLRLVATGVYLFDMMFQLFIYSYEGNNLSEESSEVAVAAYMCPWYKFSVPLRRNLLYVMIRTRKIVVLTVGGFSTLSLASFTSIIKASYSMFTLLMQVSE